MLDPLSLLSDLLAVISRVVKDSSDLVLERLVLLARSSAVKLHPFHVLAELYHGLAL